MEAADRGTAEGAANLTPTYVGIGQASDAMVSVFQLPCPVDRLWLCCSSCERWFYARDGHKHLPPEPVRVRIVRLGRAHWRRERARRARFTADYWAHTDAPRPTPDRTCKFCHRLFSEHGDYETERHTATIFEPGSGSYD